MYYLIVMKRNRPVKSSERHGHPAPRLRRWSLFGAAAACKELAHHIQLRNVPSPEARLSLKRVDDNEPSAVGWAPRPSLPRVDP
jgi:hypothetical protein